MNVLVSCDPDLVERLFSILAESRPDLTPRVFTDGTYVGDSALAVVVGRRPPAGLLGIPVLLVRKEFLRADIETALIPAVPPAGGGQDLPPIWSAPLPGQDAEAGILVENCPIGLFLHHEWVFTYVNPAFCRIFGYTRSDLTGRAGPLDLVHPDDRVRVSRSITARMSGKQGSASLQFRGVRKDGTRICVESHATTIDSAGGRVTLGSVVDVSDRRRVEDALKRSEKLTRAVLENSPFALTVRDSEGRLLMYNRSWRQLWHLEEEDVEKIEVQSAKLSFRDRFPYLRDYMDRIERLFESGGRIQLPEQQVTTPTGGRWISQRLYSVSSSEGGVDSVVVLTEDVTERRRLESELLQAQKLEALGTLIGGIAHDFNNLLTPIAGYAEMALDRMGDDPGREELEKVLEAAGKASSMVGQLMVYGRKKLLDPRPVDLREVVTGFASMASRMLGETLVLTTSLPSSPVTVMGDGDELSQMLVNLAANSRKTIRDRGGITLRLRSDKRSRKALLSYEDDGPPMDEEAASRVFEPFFASSPKVGDAGLGIPSVQAIARRHGGDARFVPGGDGRRIFEIEIPLAAAADLEAFESRPGSGDLHGRRLLVAEDDQEVGAYIRDALVSAGCVVQLVSDGALVPPLLEKGFCPEAVIADAVMPVMGAGELRRRLSESHPELPLMVISGYPGEVDAYPGTSRLVLLEKPFTMGQLVRGVERLLGG